MTFIPDSESNRLSSLRCLCYATHVTGPPRHPPCSQKRSDSADVLACGTGPVTLYWPVAYRAETDNPTLIAYATAPRAAALAEIGEDEATATAVADLGRLFPKVDVGRLLVAHRRVDWGADPLACGGYSFVRVGGAGARERLAAADTGALLWAGAATESSPIAETVEAAYLSGLRAAGEVRALLGN